MKTKIENNFIGDGNTVTNNIIVRASKRAKTEYPAGCIGADLLRRNYIRYLVERYHRFKAADGRFGKPTGFAYAVIYKNIENKFKAPTYFIPLERFTELADYLHGRIDSTILGKRNRARGQASYSTFDEYQFEQMNVGSEASEDSSV